MGADYSFYVKTIETHARAFFKVIKEMRVRQKSTNAMPYEMGKDLFHTDSAP
jgi:hypothetical protein